MGRRLTTVNRLPLVGGRLCLDFVNTTGARRSGAPRERLRSYADLLVWGRRAGILSGPEQNALGAEGRRRPEAAARSLRRLTAVRERLYSLLLSAVEGRQARSKDIQILNVLWRRLAERQVLLQRPGGLGFRLRLRPNDLGGLLWPIVGSAVDVLTSGDIDSIKKCGECDWLFLDLSKNRSRRWCKTGCGDRARARRYYARHRGQGPEC